MLSFTTEDAEATFRDWMSDLIRRRYVVEIDGTDVELDRWDDEQGPLQVVGFRWVSNTTDGDGKADRDQVVRFEWKEIGTVHVY